MTMTRLWTPNRPPFAMAPYGALVAACRPKMQQRAFSPLDIAGLQLWLKADAGLYQDAAMTTLAVLDTDPVGGWADQSGNSNHVTQATADNKPILKLAIQNGLPVVRFDGTNDSLGKAFALVQPSSVYIVFRTITWVASRKVFDGWNNVTMALQMKSGPDDFYRLYAGNGNWLPAVNASTGVFHIARCLFSGITSQLGFDSVAATISDCGTDAGAGIILGGASNVDIGEIALYNAALSAASDSALRAYLNSRWGVY